MPTGGKNAAAVDAKKKASKSKDKAKEKVSSKDKAERPKKKRDDKPKTKTKPSSEETAIPAAPTPTPAAIDPDAVQLFRRYDRTRSGAVLRSDFLQLLRDYAHLPRASGPHAMTRRAPLSLTDSRGVPLGYERAEKNSEFEAGQLFERYDKAHVGALSLDAFGAFFCDFQAPLRGFVDDLSYSASVHPLPPQQAETPPPAPPRGEDPNPTTTDTPVPLPSADPPKPPSSVRAEYQATLWELRKICKDELTQQRERIRRKMARLRGRLASRRGDRDEEDEVREHDGDHDHDDHARWSPSDDRTNYDRSWADNQLLDRCDALESDLERVDDVLRTTRRQLRKGLDASTDEMKAFLKSAPELLADARELAMKAYAASDSTQSPRRERRPEETHQRENGRRLDSLPPHQARQADTTPRPPKPGSSSVAPHDDQDHATVARVQKMLRIKDQLIYQLLQERTTLRREKAAVEADLEELSHVSTHEMRKWAELTDEMQHEIALLRDQVRRLDDDHDDDESVYPYRQTQRHA